MARKRTRKEKRFEATSLPVLSPKTLKQGKKKQRVARKTARKKPRKTSFLSKRIRAWRFSHYIALLLMLGGLAALGYLFTDVNFQVAIPHVSGNNYLDAELIQQQADVAGENIFLINPAHIAAKLTTFIPQVEEAKIRLGLPNQVVILIQERQPVLVYSRGDNIQWASNDGHLFPMTQPRDDLPLLVDEDGSATTDGAMLNPGIWDAIQEISANIPEIKEYHYREVYGLFFISPEGWRVYLGDGENMQKKLATWQIIRQQILQENRPVKKVDLRYDRVYIQ